MTFRRPSWDEYFLLMALLTGTRASCPRRAVGAVLVDRSNHVLSTGYNGPASGTRNCVESPCGGAHLPSGQGLEACEAIHAEQNALLQCSDVQRIYTCYCSASPCSTCVKLLLNTSCRRVVFATPYKHDLVSRTLWEQAGGEWVHLPPESFVHLLEPVPCA